MNISHVQEFRIQSSLPGSTTKKIPTRFDKTTGQHVVLWKHIQLAFKDAECVMMDDTLVPFMTDDDGFEEYVLILSHYGYPFIQEQYWMSLYRALSSIPPQRQSIQWRRQAPLSLLEFNLRMSLLRFSKSPTLLLLLWMPSISVSLFSLRSSTEKRNHFNNTTTST
ncbi:hypothetical protein BGX31_005534 [Mortierella sp. GBA43]|nr:hypothetical protein BGX31_005534 [Mortierella sp. GBA43]